MVYIGHTSKLYIYECSFKLSILPQLLVDSLVLGILDGYMKVNEEGKYYCTLCNKVGSRKDSTRRHVKMVHFPDAIAIKAVLDG